MDCPYNLANNRQVRMLADLKQRNTVLLDSAKENLKRMAFFGLTEFQRKTQYLFEKTFNMNFISPFTQYNSTRASSVDIDEQTQNRIEALNFLDMELYDYAKDLFLQRYQYMRQKEHQEARRKRQEQRKILKAKQAHNKEQNDINPYRQLNNKGLERKGGWEIQLVLCMILAFKKERKRFVY
uniref:Heparan-sulfate 6-O-sulfotransferase n=1 Tax=Sphenodon punctatus TaxID=8508 RepID=A0A8D0G3S4_SPHPU